jgi:hypothetical protein
MRVRVRCQTAVTRTLCSDTGVRHILFTTWCTRATAALSTACLVPWTWYVESVKNLQVFMYG